MSNQNNSNIKNIEYNKLQEKVSLIQNNYTKLQNEISILENKYKNVFQSHKEKSDINYDVLKKDIVRIISNIDEISNLQKKLSNDFEKDFFKKIEDKKFLNLNSPQIRDIFRDFKIFKNQQDILVKDIFELKDSLNNIQSIKNEQTTLLKKAVPSLAICGVFLGVLAIYISIDNYNKIIKEQRAQGPFVLIEDYKKENSIFQNSLDSKIENINEKQISILKDFEALKLEQQNLKSFKNEEKLNNILKTYQLKFDKLDNKVQTLNDSLTEPKNIIMEGLYSVVNAEINMYLGFIDNLIQIGYSPSLMLNIINKIEYLIDKNPRLPNLELKKELASLKIELQQESIEETKIQKILLIFNSTFDKLKLKNPNMVLKNSLETKEEEKGSYLEDSIKKAFDKLKGFVKIEDKNNNIKILNDSRFRSIINEFVNFDVKTLELSFWNKNGKVFFSTIKNLENIITKYFDDNQAKSEWLLFLSQLEKYSFDKKYMDSLNKIKAILKEHNNEKGDL